MSERLSEGQSATWYIYESIVLWFLLKSSISRSKSHFYLRQPCTNKKCAHFWRFTFRFFFGKIVKRICTFCGFSFNWKETWADILRERTKKNVASMRRVAGKHCSEIAVDTSGWAESGQRSKVHQIKYSIYASHEAFPCQQRNCFLDRQSRFSSRKIARLKIFKLTFLRL